MLDYITVFSYWNAQLEALAFSSFILYSIEFGIEFKNIKLCVPEMQKYIYHSFF